MPIEVQQNGEVFTWIVRTCNSGPEDATGTTVLNEITPGVVILKAAPSTGTYDIPSKTWNIGDFPVGDCATLTLTMRVDNITLAPFTNTSTISSNEYDPVELGNSDNDMVADKCTQYSGCFRIEAGTNITITGSGIPNDPYIVNALALPVTNHGVFNNDAHAGDNAVPVGEAYELSSTNTYGLPEGFLKIRRN